MKIRLGKYKHFKGNIYEVIAIATHTETNEELVIYNQANFPEKLWARSVTMFLEEIEKPEYNYKGPRFVYLEE